jgi:hypothetical protein
MFAMKRFLVRLITPLITLTFLSGAYAQEQVYFNRLPAELFNVTPPSARVSGTPGTMSIQQSSCRSASAGDMRQQIVNTAVQEWAYFGFSVLEQSVNPAPNPVPRSRRTFPRLDPEESARVADSIAGYWSATSDGSWILAEQNNTWSGPAGIASRWRNPWSAAFISWVMCESGLGEPELFERAIAHHSYIDQAILARDANDSKAAYMAYDLGEQEILPGDLLCRGSRPAYKSIAQRRDQLGVGARTHCDIVVNVDGEAEQILTIGGNVRASVRLKLFQASLSDDGHLSPQSNPNRPLFAHLKLDAAPVALDALGNSPTMNAVTCTQFEAPTALAKLGLPETSGTC